MRVPSEFRRRVRRVTLIEVSHERPTPRTVSWILVQRIGLARIPLVRKRAERLANFCRGARGKFSSNPRRSFRHLLMSRSTNLKHSEETTIMRKRFMIVLFIACTATFTLAQTSSSDSHKYDFYIGHSAGQ